MRRLLLPTSVAFGLLMVVVGPASAQPSPGAGEPKAVPGTKVCKVQDRQLDELSGLIATDDGYIVVNDSSDVDTKRRVFFLDGKCKVTKSQGFAAPARDPEDLALSRDGKTLWIADLGDNVTSDQRRKTVALWSMPADGSKKAVIHRLSYPDGAHDAEALLISGDGTPVIVTKDPNTPGIYVPAGPLQPDSENPVALKKVGQLTLPASSTPNPLLGLGRVVVTGGAVNRDGSRVALRTYADALEWDVQNGDVVAAIQKPARVTPLPDEPFGEALAYTPDGKSFLTVSDMGGRPEDLENHVLRYTPSVQVVTSTAQNRTQPAAKPAAGSWLTDVTLRDVNYLVGGVGVLGAILVALGVSGITRARRRAAEPGKLSPEPGKVSPAARTVVLDVSPDPQVRPATGPAAGRPAGSAAGPAAAGAVAGAAAGARPGGRPGAPAKKGAVYGGKPAGPAAGVYGGSAASGPGRPAATPPAAPPPVAAPPSATPPAGTSSAPARRGGVYGAAPSGGTAPRRAPEPPAGRAPERAPARAPERAPGRAPERAPGRAPGRAPERAPERAPGRTPGPGGSPTGGRGGAVYGGPPQAPGAAGGGSARGSVYGGGRTTDSARPANSARPATGGQPPTAVPHGGPPARAPHGVAADGRQDGSVYGRR